MPRNPWKGLTNVPFPATDRLPLYIDRGFYYDSSFSGSFSFIAGHSGLIILYVTVSLIKPFCAILWLRSTPSTTSCNRVWAISPGPHGLVAVLFGRIVGGKIGKGLDATVDNFKDINRMNKNIVAQVYEYLGKNPVTLRHFW